MFVLEEGEPVMWGGAMGRWAPNSYACGLSRKGRYQSVSSRRAPSSPDEGGDVDLPRCCGGGGKSGPICCRDEDVMLEDGCTPYPPPPPGMICADWPRAPAVPSAGRGPEGGCMIVGRLPCPSAGVPRGLEELGGALWPPIGKG